MIDVAALVHSSLGRDQLPETFAAPLLVSPVQRAVADWPLSGSTPVTHPARASPPTVTPVNGHLFLPNCGHDFSPLVAIKSPHWWP